MTAEYYNRHAQEFFERTKNLDMTALYLPFLELVKPGGHILDAGCGSGRDSLYFLSRGMRVTAFDASSELAKLASRLMGQPVLTMTFDDMDFEQVFDGIWTCASLLHVPRNHLGNIMPRFVRALRPGGIWYLSFKNGQSERINDGRYFSDLTEDQLRSLISAYSQLELVKLWETADVRGDRPSEAWVNALVKRTAE